MLVTGDAALRISVALCTHNGARFLPEQLKGFLDQQRHPDEIIICDDVSTDATLELLEAFARSAPFPVRIYRNSENLGYSRNFMKSVGLCSGDIIAFSDQDDVWYARKLLRLEQFFLSHPDAGGIFSDGDLIDTSSRRIPGTLWASFQFRAKDQRRVAGGDCRSGADAAKRSNRDGVRLSQLLAARAGAHAGPLAT